MNDRQTLSFDELEVACDPTAVAKGIFATFRCTMILSDYNLYFVTDNLDALKKSTCLDDLPFYIRAYSPGLFPLINEFNVYLDGGTTDWWQETHSNVQVSCWVGRIYGSYRARWRFNIPELSWVAVGLQRLEGETAIGRYSFDSDTLKNSWFEKAVSVNNVDDWDCGLSYRNEFCEHCDRAEAIQAIVET